MKTMKKHMFLMLMLAVMGACEKDSFIEDLTNPTIPSSNDGGNNNGGNDNGGNNGGNPTIDDDLTTFTISIDKSFLDETETIPTDESDTYYEDYVENSSFNKSITITYDGTTATASDEVDGVEVAINGADVTVTSTIKKVEYILTGSTTDGSFKIYSDNKFKLTLNGVSITNSDGAAINVQSKKRVFVELSGESTLTDGSSYNTPEDEDEKGTFFSEGQLLFSGNGSLSVTGNYKHGIVSDDYLFFRPGNSIYVTTAKGHGLKANDAVVIKGGVLNVEVSGAAKKGISCDDYVLVEGGRTTLITTGDGKWDSDDNDVSGCAGIKADGTFTMNAGSLLIKSTGKGGKGINTDQDIEINGGTMRVITTGAQYVYGSYDTKAKGIKADGALTINDGDIKVRATGGEGSEGIESKTVMTINGGEVKTYTYDDGLNAKSAINITGGSIYAYATNNDAIDSNGTLSISGGIVIANGAGQPEGGFDCDQNTFAITGGILVGIGGEHSTPTTSACKQPVILYGNSTTLTQNTLISLNSGSSNLLTYKLPRSASVLLVSAPGLSTGSTYTIGTGGTLSGGTSFMGLTTGGTLSNFSEAASLTLSSIVTTSGNIGGMNGGGGFPGGGQPGRR